jgi:hypothetical protein
MWTWKYVPIHVRIWLATPAGLGFQWVKLVRVWSVTSRILADCIYTYIYIQAWLPSQAPRRGLASQTRTCMGTLRATERTECWTTWDCCRRMRLVLQQTHIFCKFGYWDEINNRTILFLLHGFEVPQTYYRYNLIWFSFKKPVRFNLL